VTQWVEFQSAEDIALAAADTIEEHARFAIQQRGEFKLVLAGGSTPVACYELLAKRKLQWDYWKLFYGDERCLAQDDAERNSSIVAATGLTKNISHHFVIPAELGAEKGAEQYSTAIKDQMPFDTVLLGMGEDGHTASLFPGHDWVDADAEQSVIAVHDAPKPPPDRISLTLPTLQQCRQMLVLVSGESKRGAVKRWRQGEDLPVARVAAIAHATVFIETDLKR
jgi:6-phosphogluconolactonase